jgi:uncharacterized protein
LTKPPFIAVGISTRALLETTGEARPACTSIDFFADRDTRHGIQKALRIGEFMEAARHIERASDANGQVGVLWAGGIENNFELVYTVEQNPLARNLGCSSESIRKARDPHAVATALEQAGIPVLEVGSCVPLATNSKWIAKPLQSGGGMYARLMTDPSESLDPAQQYLQRFAEGFVYGATFIGTGKSANLIGCCRQLPSTHPTAPFRYEGSIGPLSISETLARQVRNIGECVAKQFGLRGWFGIDFVFESEQVWLLEINPRFTASMELVNGRSCRSLFQLHLAAFDPALTDGSPEPADMEIRFERKPIAAKQILFNDTNQNLAINADKSDALWDLNQNLESTVCDVPDPDWVAVPGSPICTIRTEGDSESQVLDQLAQTKKAVASILK